MKLFAKNTSNADTNTTWLSGDVKYRGIPKHMVKALEKSILKGKIKNKDNGSNNNT